MTQGCSRRCWLAVAGALFAARAPVRAAAAPTRVEPRTVPPFHALHWQLAGELRIEQTGRERVSVEAEAAVLPRILTEVSDGRLRIGFAPGRVQTSAPLRVVVELRALDALQADGAGTLQSGELTAAQSLRLHLRGSESLRIARLQARHLDVRLDGSGELHIDGGRVDQQQLVIAGSADYRARRLESFDANVSIPGSGTAWLWASRRLEVAIEGSGDLRFRGNPQLTQRMEGSGSVQREND